MIALAIKDLGVILLQYYLPNTYKIIPIIITINLSNYIINAELHSVQSDSNVSFAYPNSHSLHKFPT